jgi:hypothetical protein
MDNGSLRVVRHLHDAMCELSTIDSEDGMEEKSFCVVCAFALHLHFSGI